MKKKNLTFLLVLFFAGCSPEIYYPRKMIPLIQYLLLTYPDVEVVQEGKYISEGGSQKILIRLRVQPIDSVNIPIRLGSDLIQSNLNYLSFSPENWDVYQKLYLFASEDLYYEPNQNILVFLGPVESSDIYDNGKIKELSYEYSNNEPLGYNLFYWNTWEDSPTSIDVSLLSKPKDNVTVYITNPDSSQMSLSTTSITFTPLNWSTLQTIGVIPVDDSLQEGDQTYHITLSAVSAEDSYYNGYSQIVPITIYDNDIPNLRFSLPSFMITEGNSYTGEIKLTTSPTFNVTMTISSLTPSFCTITSGSSLTFNSSDYNTYKYFTITARPADDIDNINESSALPNCQIKAEASSADPNHNGLYSHLDGKITDNRNAYLIVNTSSLPNLMESGTTTTFTLKLNSKPEGTVTVCIKSTNYCEAFIDSIGINPADGTCSSIGANTPYVSFNASDWNNFKTITVKARHDWDYRNSGSIPETGERCFVPYPDGTKSYAIKFHTFCSGCNAIESAIYHTTTSEVSGGINGNVIDDLDYYAYVTSASHDGDFAIDSTLTGSNAIEKADDFCAIHKPSGLTGSYKALLVDGTNRSAFPSLINWVLKPNKYYFRNTDNQLMFKTDSNSKFIFGDADAYGPPPDSYWTGLNGGTWATDLNCLGWSNKTNVLQG